MKSINLVSQLRQTKGPGFNSCESYNFGFIAGETAPKGRTMGHAGAIVGGDEDTAEAKKKILRACGIIVVNSPADIGIAMAKALAEEKRKESPHHHANRVD